MQFIILAYDHTDAEALNRRMAVRADHVKSCDKLRDEGKLLYGVAMLNKQGNMCGSIMVTDFQDRAALERWIIEEPYVKGNVWARYEIIPAKVGPSFEHLKRA